MNAPFLLAQALPQVPGLTQPRLIQLTKPAGNQSVTVHLDGATRLDFSRIGNETVTLVRVGEKLIILFDNQTTVTVEPVFGTDGQPRADVAFVLTGDRIVTGAEFVTLFPITTDQSVLPAAGTAGGPASGASFHDHGPVDPLGDSRQTLDLLGSEPLGSATLGAALPPLPSVGTLPVIGTGDAGTVDDGALSDGNLDSGESPGDAPGASASVTGSLHVNFNGDVIGRSLAFSAAQPGLEGLFSGGLPVTIAIGRSAIVGHTGNPADPVFVITLDAGPLEGAYTFTLFRALDHAIRGAEDSLPLPISFIAIDGNGDTAAGTFVVAVNDDSPRVNNIATSMGENDTASIDLGNSISFGADHAAATPIVSSFAGFTNVPANVSLGSPPARIVGNSLEVAPGHRFDELSLGEDVRLHFTYAATDGDGDTVLDDIVITVNGANDAPVAGINLGVVLSERANTTGSSQLDTASLRFTFTDVDLNDVGHAASVTAVTPSGNTAGLPATGLLSFLTIDSVTKAAGASVGRVGWTFSAPDRTFDYLAEGETVTFAYAVTVDDGDGGTLAETVTVIVTGTNDAPQPQNDTATASEDTPLIVTATNGVLANDIDVEGDPISLVTGPTGDFTTAQGGTIHFNADGSYFYTPAANFNGIDSVSYVVQDTHGATATAALNITVNAVNDAPAISGLQNVAVAEGQVGALIDTFTVSDVDTAAGLSFRVLDGIGNVDTRFTVVAVSGTTFGQPGTYELRLAPGQSLSFVAESADGHPTIVRTVEVNDQGGTNNIGTASITMTVEDANAAPTVTSATAIGAIVEDQSFGAPPQLINNGGFESWTYNSQTGTYTIPNWTFAGNFFYPPGVVGIEHSGGAALGVYTFNSGSGGTASETFATVAGQHYHMQFFLEKERAGAGNAFSASWNGETLVAIANQTTFGNYVQYDFDVVGADGASTLQFNFVSGVASYWFLDDVSVTPAYTPGVELRSGRISFADADLTDSHTVAVRPDTSGYVGNFTWTLTDSTGTGAGRINWNFNVSDADIQYLGPSSTLTQTYHVVINDGHGGSVTQDVTVALAGVNDTPTGNLTIGGVPTVNQILTATNTLADAEGLGTLHYQWQRSDGAGWINVGNDQASYALVAADIGRAMRLVVSYVDGGGTSETIASAPTAVIGNVNSAPIVTSVTDSPVGLDVAVNGGFETGNLTGWTQSGDTSFTSVITTNVHSGTYDLRAGPSSNGFITQNFATAAGQSYLISFWVRSDSGAPPAELTASWNGGTLLTLTNTAGQPYSEYTFEVSATVASTSLTFGFSNASSWWYLDDVTLRPAGQTQSGQITFIDANPTDTHIASFVPAGQQGYVGVFTVSAAATESGGNGFFNWQFTLTDAEAQALSAGPHTQTYSVIIDDGHGGFVTQDVTVTFQGHTTPPAGADHTVTMVEDVSHTFTATDFGFSDADGGQFAGVVITTLPGTAAGQLLCRNTAVTAGQFITAADIAAGMLIYAPRDNALDDASFTFQVRDDAPGGSAVRTDQSPNTMTIDMDSANYQDLANTQSGNNTTYPDATGFALTASSPNDHVSVRDSSGSSDAILVNTTSGTTFTDLAFARADNNLEIGWAVASGSRTVTILDAYSTANRVENFRLDEGGSYAGVTLGTSNYTLVSGLTGSNSANDIIAGSGASETLSGQGGNDLLFGNGGNDTLRGGTGTNVLDGGAGLDLLDFSDASSGVDFALTQSSSFTTATLGASYGGATKLDSYRNIEGVIGSNSADTLTGSTLGDFLNGGGGADILIGGTGSDQLTGGSAADIFRYLAGDNANGETDDILDFATGASGDVLDLSGVLSSVVPADREAHVRFHYGDGSTRLLSADLSPPPTSDGDVTIQVNLGGSSWSNVAVIHDTGANLTAGSEVIRMMLDATQTQFHV